jgi:hypothetical protein
VIGSPRRRFYRDDSSTTRRRGQREASDGRAHIEHEISRAHRGQELTVEASPRITAENVGEKIDILDRYGHLDPATVATVAVAPQDVFSPDHDDTGMVATR